MGTIEASRGLGKAALGENHEQTPGQITSLHFVQPAQRLHPSTSEDRKRAALNCACPEGYRSGWYFEVWQDEARRALAGHKPEPPRSVEITETGVSCGWCNYPHSGGCMCCYRARRQYEASKQQDKP
jgi:hypothetical protein